MYIYVCDIMESCLYEVMMVRQMRLAQIRSCQVILGNIMLGYFGLRHIFRLHWLGISQNCRGTPISQVVASYFSTFTINIYPPHLFNFPQLNIFIGHNFCNNQPVPVLLWVNQPVPVLLWVNQHVPVLLWVNQHVSVLLWVNPTCLRLIVGKPTCLRLIMG